MCAVSCPAYIYMCIYTVVYVHVHAPRYTVVGLQTYDSRGTSECRIHVCRCEVGKDLACVSWIVREISFSRAAFSPTKD